MDITQLNYFKAIAETGSLTKAAEKFHISQPAMSAMLKKLEEELDVELFDREPNRIRLNPVGEIALVHVNTILHNINQMKTDLLSAAQQTQTLSVAFCDPGVRWYCVPHFSLAYPDIQLKDELYINENPVQLLSERIYDLIITPEPVNKPHIVSIPFLRDRVYLSVPKINPLAQCENLSLNEIPAQPLLFPQIGGYFLEQIGRKITDKSYPIQLIKNSYSITQHLIQTTEFLATISELSTNMRNDGSNRKLIPLNDSELNVMLYLSFLDLNHHKVKNFLEWAITITIPASSAYQSNSSVLPHK